MVSNKTQHEKPDSEAIRMVLDQALGQVKATTFTVLYTIGQLVQKTPGSPITMAKISMVCGVGERTTKAAVKELHKALILDIIETPKGNVFEFISPATDPDRSRHLQVHDDHEIPAISRIERGANFSGTTSESYRSTEQDRSITRSLEQVPGVTKSAPETRSQRPGRLNIFSPEIQDLVDHFESLVLPHAKQRITARRRAKWYSSVIYLVFTRKRPLAEIHSVFDWLFTDWHGYLPIWMPREEERKITRVAQISRNYDSILEIMSRKEPA
ncbi:hypothetical protein Mycsm_01272 [Mycobacterium sp. JS623]|uniref:hypothetical protein n=1 Tax=Mycobacterium sp. JS623 TaxID=212767 RepID=UPI0002A5B24D|nr:hypothetical protein [Mycobacterium sp. JS623]AGB21689.1 hypothetical protein Mycsm_01272 [Mycobacterium sp. JS623]